MSGWRLSSCGTAAAVAASLTLAACGGGSGQDAHEPTGNFTVQVMSASFPTVQRLSQHTHMVITVRNAGTVSIPNLAVTICNVTCAYPAPSGEGTSAQAFAQNLNQPYVANPSRPVWVVDHPPGQCTGNYSVSCQSGGPGGDVTAYANTWALGHPLAPGATATFDWAVTAVRSGTHIVAWEVAAGLNGKAKAVLADRGRPNGRFRVLVHRAPQQSYVNDRGQIVISK